jgi:hypothetical protein
MSRQSIIGQPIRERLNWLAAGRAAMRDQGNAVSLTLRLLVATTAALGAGVAGSGPASPVGPFARDPAAACGSPETVRRLKSVILSGLVAPTADAAADAYRREFVDGAALLVIKPGIVQPATRLAVTCRADLSVVWPGLLVERFSAVSDDPEWVSDIRGAVYSIGPGGAVSARIDSAEVAGRVRTMASDIALADEKDANAAERAQAAASGAER